MATYLLKKSYQLKDLKEITFKDLWGDHGVFTTMWIFGKQPKILFFDKHINNLIKSLKIYGIIRRSLKKDIIKEYRNTQTFFAKFIDSQYKINERDVLFGGIGCCMFLYQYLSSRKIPTFYFIDNNFGKYDHLGAPRKLEFLDEFHKLNGGPPLI